MKAKVETKQMNVKQTLTKAVSKHAMVKDDTKQFPKHNGKHITHESSSKENKIE